MAFDLLIQNGTIVTVNHDFDIIENGMIGINGTKLSYVGPCPDHGPPPASKEHLDARGGLILPGLINTHTHLPMSLFRGLADDLPLYEWLNHHIFPAEGKYMDPQTVRAGTLLACCEMLLSGTTTCCDGYFFEAEVALAVQRSGMRAVLGQGIVDFPAPDVNDSINNVAHAEQFVTDWQTVSHRIMPSIFCHSPYTCSGDTLRRAKTAANENGVLFQIHVAETREEVRQVKEVHGLSPVAYLDHLGVLDPLTLAVHAVWVSSEDISILAESGAAVSHNPESNMKLAAGAAPLVDMLGASLRVGLGTDSCASNNDLDLFGAMAMAARLHKATSLDPTVVDAACALRMATIGGAEAIGWSGHIGSLEPEKEADLIVLDIHKPHLVPMYNPISQLVYAAKGSDVRDVVVAGRPLVRNRKLMNIDLKEIMGQVGAC